MTAQRITYALILFALIFTGLGFCPASHDYDLKSTLCNGVWIKDYGWDEKEITLTRTDSAQVFAVETPANKENTWGRRFLVEPDKTLDVCKFTADGQLKVIKRRSGFGYCGIGLFYYKNGSWSIEKGELILKISGDHSDTNVDFIHEARYEVQKLEGSLIVLKQAEIIKHIGDSHDH